MLRKGCLWLLIMALLRPTAAAADSRLESARQHAEALRYEQARVLLEQGVERGRLQRGPLLEYLALLAELAAIIDGPEAGERAFRRLLVVHPGWAEPVRRSPVVREPFARAKAWVEEHGALTVDLQPPSQLEPGQPGVVAVAVTSDPLAMVSGVRLHYRLSGGGYRELPGRSLRASLPAVPGGTYLDYYLSVVDAHDNELVNFGSRAQPLVVQADQDASEVELDSGPQRTSATRTSATWVVGGAGVAALAAAISFDAAAGSEYSSLEDRCAPICLEQDLDTFRFRKRVAGGLYIGAAALVVSAVILWIAD